MPSTRNPTSKRASLPRTFDFAKSFRKDWERLGRSGRYDLHRLKESMLLLIGNDGPLKAEWKDHPLQGEWADCRECHAGGDFLLIYLVEDDHLTFVRAGTHSELFE